MGWDGEIMLEDFIRNMKKNKDRSGGRETMLIPEKLGNSEVNKIIRELNDPRLRGDEDVEHFTIKTRGKTYFIAKHRFIPLLENGKVNQIKIKDYLESLLDKIESED